MRTYLYIASSIVRKRLMMNLTVVSQLSILCYNMSSALPDHDLP